MSQSGYTPIQLYRSTTSGSVPSVSNLAAGELAINIADRKLFVKNVAGTAVLPIGGGATGGGSDSIFYENGQTVTTDYTITSGNNAMTTGPISINSGVTVTVPSGSVWVVI